MPLHVPRSDFYHRKILYYLLFTTAICFRISLLSMSLRFVSLRHQQRNEIMKQFFSLSSKRRI